MSQAETRQYVFLSYASEDRDHAALIAQALQSRGVDVWWDVDIPTGVHYPKFIEDALKSAACVIVLWSHSSTTSRWVRNEADWGAETETLVPIRIDDTDLPWEFRNFQTLDLSHWKGDTDDPAFARLIQGVQMRLVDSESADPDGLPSPAPPPVAPAAVNQPKGRSARPRWLLPLVLVAFLAGATIVVLQTRERGSESPTPIVATTRLAFEHLTGDGCTRSSAISPDGNYAAYTRQKEGLSDLCVEQIDTGRKSFLIEADTQVLRSPVFSPDGVYIYYARLDPELRLDRADARYDLFRISMLGGDPRKITSGVVGRRFDCSADGKRLAFIRHEDDTTRVVIAQANGSAETTLSARPRDRSIRFPCIAWSADDTEVLTTRRDPETKFLEIVAYPVGGGPERTAPGGQWQAVMDIRPRMDGAGLLVLGMPRTAPNRALNLWQLPAGGAVFTSVTNDADSYYQVSADRTGQKMALTYYEVRRILRVIDLTGQTRDRDLSTDRIANGRVVWADQDRLLTNRNIGNRVGLVFLNLDDGAASNVATDVEYVAGIALSPDGRNLAYRSMEGNDHWLWLAGTDGSSTRRLTADGDSEYGPQFTANGQDLVFARRRGEDKGYYLWKKSLTDGAELQLCEIPGREPFLSPDCTRIAADFQSPETGKLRPGWIPVSGGAPQFITLPPQLNMLGWNPEGTGLTCWSREDGGLVIWDVPMSGGEPRRLTDFNAERTIISSAAWSPDGSSLAVSLEFVAYDAMMLQMTP